MPPPGFKRVAELFHEAVALPPEERPAFLDTVCAGDAELRAAVEELLRHDADATDIFRASPVAREAAEARQDFPTLTGPHADGDGPPPGPLPRIPGYELLRELGRGGMGVVYLARHVGLKRLVALKMLPATQATPQLVARFRTEAEVLARLQHANIVPIYDVGEFEGHPYFTMEYVAGPSLVALLDGRPQDVAVAAYLVEVLARAAHAVHQCGIVHRDLKPGNVLLGAHGLEPGGVAGAKITDFGIAMDLRAANRLTRAGTIIGTPSYMAPEQVRNARGGVGPAADVYALGSILYELLTGRPPFDAPTPVETIAQLVNQEPLSPSRLRPRLPADLATICLRCLEKSPRRRYASAWELAEDLRRFRAGQPIQARPVGPLGHVYRWALRRPVVAGLYALCITLTVAFIGSVVVYDALLREALSNQVEEERQEIVQLNVTIAVTEVENGDTFTAVLRYAEALNLDESAGVSGSEYRAKIAAVLRHCPRLLRMQTHQGAVVCTSLTADGGWVASAGADHRIQVWDVLTGQPRGPALNADEAVTSAALGDDGRLLATVGAGGTVRLWDVPTGKARALPLESGAPVSRVTFPGGGRVLLTEQKDSAVRLWDLTGDEIVPLPRPWANAAVRSVLSEDGRWLFTVDDARAWQAWDMTNGKAVGPALKPEQDLTPTAASVDGRRVALVGEDGTARVWDAAHAKWSPALSDVRRVAISPNAEHVFTDGRVAGARTWSPDLGEGFRIPSRDGGPVTYAWFSTVGGILVVAHGLTARVWDIQSGRPVTPPLRHATPVVAATWNPESNQFVTVSQAGTVRVWQLPRFADGDPDPQMAWDLASDAHSRAEILAWARLLACERINRKQQREALNEETLRAAWEEVKKEQGHAP